MEEPGRLQSMGSLELDTTERLHFHFSLSCIGEGNGNPLQCSCLENPRDGEAWWAAVYGSHRVGHDWSDLAAAEAGESLICTPNPLCRMSYFLLAHLQLPPTISIQKKPSIFFTLNFSHSACLWVSTKTQVTVMNSLARASPEYLVFACSHLGEFHLFPQFLHCMKLPITEVLYLNTIAIAPLEASVLSSSFSSISLLYPSAICPLWGFRKDTLILNTLFIWLATGEILFTLNGHQLWFWNKNKIVNLFP